MLKNSKAFSSFSTGDIEAAKMFYGETLGLSVQPDEMGVLRLEIGNGLFIMIYPKPNHSPATFTVLNFEVDDIEAEVAALAEKGVKFEKYDLPGLKADEKGIHTGDGPTIAWFKDRSGNIVSVIERQ